MRILRSQDKIGNPILSGSNIEIPASRITIGGRQFRPSGGLLSVSVPSLTANNLYFIYAVQSGGAVSLVINQNVNSVGPSGHVAWKLVGAFYADGLSTVGFGSFVTIEGRPSTENIKMDGPVTNITSNVDTEGANWWRRGSHIILNGGLKLNGDITPSSVGANLPSNLLANANALDIGLTGGTGDHMVVGFWRFVDANSFSENTGGDVAYDISSSFLVFRVNGSGNLRPDLDSPNMNSNDALKWQFEVPIQGWTNTPLKDL